MILHHITAWKCPLVEDMTSQVAGQGEGGTGAEVPTSLTLLHASCPFINSKGPVQG